VKVASVRTVLPSARVSSMRGARFQKNWQVLQRARTRGQAASQ
jgi:hypothetical protein